MAALSWHSLKLRLPLLIVVLFLERVHDLRAKGCGMRIGMGCKAQTTDIAVAMARICNAADRPRPRLHTREEIVNTF